MSLLAWIIVFSLLGGVLSVIAAAVLLVLPEQARVRLLPHLVSFAIGALLGAAFLALLPHALQGPPYIEFHALGMTVLIGLLGFFLVEKILLWRHCHAGDCEAHAPVDHLEGGRSAGTLILIGDGIHNLIDGVLIAAAFLTSVELGIVTALAVAAHEIPQEVGDFAVLLHSGFSRAKALVFNMLSSLTTVIGALIAYFALADFRLLLPYVLAVAAASFIYIAVADLIPSLHRRPQFRATVQQLTLILAGVFIIYGADKIMH